MDNGHHISDLVEIETKIKINKTPKKKHMYEMGLAFHISTNFDVRKEFHT
jgi:hypothetical protein